MSPWAYPIIFLGSLVLSLTLVRLSIHLSYRLDHLDRPDGERKLQEQAIPKMGGVAVAIAFSIVIVAATALLRDRISATMLLGVMIPGVAMAALGFVDDRRHLSPWLRLALQFLFAGVAWMAGTQVDLVSSDVINAVIMALWVVAIVNALNMLDNSDGLAGATTLVAAASTAVIAMSLGQYLVASLAWGLSGVAAGFLWHNWYPARVYLGDAGSYFLGYMLAILTIRLKPTELSIEWAALVPLLLLALPIVDMAFVVTRRLGSGVHPFTAGRDHLSHALQSRGLSIPTSVIVLQSLLLATCTAAVAIGILG